MQLYHIEIEYCFNDYGDRKKIIENKLAYAGEIQESSTQHMLLYECKQYILLFTDILWELEDITKYDEYNYPEDNTILLFSKNSFDSDQLSYIYMKIQQCSLVELFNRLLLNTYLGYEHRITKIESEIIKAGVNG
jgi:hypothetical protein